VECSRRSVISASIRSSLGAAGRLPPGPTWSRCRAHPEPRLNTEGVVG
jgi:hypothetical protein